MDFRKNHDKVMSQEQTGVRDMFIGIVPHEVKESVLGPSMTLESTSVNLLLWAWHGTKPCTEP